MDKYIGKLLDNRYEMLEILGVGGMAVVYKARDRVLDRYVAIKIMKEEFAGDEEFRRRFRNESQAVAKLSHNNIVSVYDVSRSEDVQYIVMELIEGITLKEYLQQKGRLSWQETIFFAQQISRALSHAHSRGIVHQDIKPHNIILLRDGTVKVTDFGIARFEKNQETRVIQEAIGSVHYISPEQAKGSRINHCADLYSLGIVMYECLTGRVPFDGDTPLAIVMQHMNAQAPLPSQVVPGIPLGMDDIVMRAMCPTLAKRYQSADEIYNDLERLKNDPRLRFSAVGAASRDPLATTDETIAIPRVPHGQTASARSAASAGQQPHRTASRQAPYRGASPARDSYPGNAGHDPYRGDRGSVPRQRQPVYDADEEAERRPSRSGRRNQKTKLSDSPAAMVGIAVAIFAVIAIGVAIFLIRAGGMFGGDSKLDVPSLVGMQFDDAVTQYGNQFTIREDGARVPDDHAQEGEILSQTPDSGKIVQGATITVTVCGSPEEDEPEEFTLPATVIGEYASTVEAMLSAHNIRVMTTQEPSAEVEKDKVIRTEPAAGSRLTSDDVVTLYVSTGLDDLDVKVPQLLGKTESEAQGALEEVHLVLGKVRGVDNDAPAGEVVGQSIPADTQTKAKTKVDIEISNGPKQEEPDPEPMPDPETGSHANTPGYAYVTIQVPAEASSFQVTITDSAGREVVSETCTPEDYDARGFQVSGTAGQSETYTITVNGMYQGQQTVTFRAQ